MSNFTRFDYFVRGKHADAQRGQVAEGYAEYPDAARHAGTLAEDAAFQDVLLISRRSHGAIVEVFKGVQWFCEAELNALYPGWRRVDGPFVEESIGQDASRIDRPARADAPAAA